MYGIFADNGSGEFRVDDSEFYTMRAAIIHYDSFNTNAFREIWPDEIHPDGHSMSRQFQIEDFMDWHYSLDP